MNKILSAVISNNLTIFKVEVDDKHPYHGEQPILIVKWRINGSHTSHAMTWNLLNHTDPMNVISIELQNNIIEITTEYLKQHNEKWLEKFYNT